MTEKNAIRQDAANGLRDHPLRFDLSNELHARPFEQLDPPEQISYIAMTTGEGTANRDLAHVRSLCDRMGVHPPADTASHFSADFGPFRLRWERHTEFATYSFLRTDRLEDPFSEAPIDYVPPEWLAATPGDRLVAVNMAFLPKDAPDPDPDQLGRWFVSDSLVTSLIASEEAQVWADFRIHSDGFSRMLIKDRGLKPRKAGRVLQRLLEVETYCKMALLALPLARATGPQTAHIDTSLAGLTSRMAESDETDEAYDDRDMLHELSGLSARIERHSAATSYRFSASRAYYALMQARLEELNEQRVPGYQRLGAFLDRRMAPAMRTCQSVSDRLADMSRRATRAANLLRTRVDFALQAQNQALLVAMARRSKLQLRLQETVEGLSVAAITYYAVGLVAYAAKATAKAGLPVDVNLAAGVSIPIIAGMVWLGVRRVRKAIMADDH